MKKLFLVKLFFLSCISMTIYSKSPIIIGHRGASGYEPENTLRSFARALDMGVDMIELDVYKIKSGEIVVIHDDTVDRTTNGSGKVKELTWDQLKKLYTKYGEHIPKLSDVFDLINNKIIIDIEIKDPDATESVANLIKDYLNKNWSIDCFLVSSFNLQAIDKIKKILPDLKTGAIFDEHEKNMIDKAKKVKADFIVINYKDANKNLITLAHKNKLKVFAYTVNSKTEAKKLVKLNIDGIATNYPDILK